MITCSVCGGLNDPNNVVCEHCGSDLIDEIEVISYYGDSDNSSFDDSNDDSENLYIDDDEDYEDY